MNKTKYNIIQLHAALSIIGYRLFQSIFVMFFGDTTQLSSIVYEGGQVILSLYVLYICKKSIHVENKNSILFFYSIFLLLYTLRMILDFFIGPFSGKVAPVVFLQDFLTIICLTFFAAWAMIASRRWLNVELITKWVFWLGIIAIVFIRFDMQFLNIENDYTGQRMEVAGGLTTLAILKVAVFVIIAAFHLLLNDKEKRIKIYIYIIGILLGGWMAFASGSRGGVVGLVVALGVYFVFSSRRNPLLIAVAILSIVIFIINLVPILFWLSEFFPVFSDRMLLTILENDQSGREEIREQAMNVILQNPIFGYSYRLYGFTTGYRTHNGILDVIIALGIPIGLFFVFIVYIKGTILAIRNMTDKRLFYPTVMTIFVLVSSLSSSSITDSGFNFSVCLLCSACFYKRKEVIKIKNDKMILNSL